MLQLIDREVLPSPLLYLSSYFEATREEYYARLLRLTEGGEWEEWLRYVFTGVADQADEVLRRIRLIDDLRAAWRQELGSLKSGIPEAAAQLFIENPFWSVRRLSERLNVAFTTAQRAIDRLEKARIVELVGDAKRNRLYYARDVLEILEEPRRIAARPALPWSEP